MCWWPRWDGALGVMDSRTRGGALRPIVVQLVRLVVTLDGPRRGTSVRTRRWMDTWALCVSGTPCVVVTMGC